MAIIIYPPTIDWNWMTQRPQHIMRQFAEDGHEVYFCNKTQSNHKTLSYIQENLAIVHNNKKFISNCIPNLKRKGTKIVLWVTCAKHYLFSNQYFPDVVVFDYVDDFARWAPYVEKMVKRSDLVFATARKLKREIDLLFPEKRCLLVPNACEIKHFQQYRLSAPPPKPVEFQDHQGPIFGYVGAWARWIDQDLVKQVAQSFPDALVAIIGAEFGEKVDQSLPNMRYIGLKPYDQLPQYLYYCNVCLIPFLKNRITNATNPVKMYEYLAAGKPVVSTDLPETRKIPFVINAFDKKDFIAKIHEALSPDFCINNDKLDEWLASNSWEKRYGHIKQSMQALMKDFDRNEMSRLESKNDLVLHLDRTYNRLLEMAHSKPVELQRMLNMLESHESHESHDSII